MQLAQDQPYKIEINGDEATVRHLPIILVSRTLCVRIFLKLGYIFGYQTLEWPEVNGLQRFCSARGLSRLKAPLLDLITLLLLYLVSTSQ